MKESRWTQLMNDDKEPLLPSEIAIGWHFCNDYDGLLVGPTMGEWHTCTCFRPNTKLAKRRRCAAAGFELAPETSPQDLEAVF